MKKKTDNSILVLPMRMSPIGIFNADEFELLSKIDISEKVNQNFYNYLAIEKGTTEIVGGVIAELSHMGSIIIWTIEIKSSFQNRGIERQLIQEVEKKKGKEPMLVFFHKEDAVESFYKSIGFDTNMQAGMKV